LVTEQRPWPEQSSLHALPSHAGHGAIVAGATPVARRHEASDSSACERASTQRTTRVWLPSHVPSPPPEQRPKGPTSHCGSEQLGSVHDSTTTLCEPHDANGTSEKLLAALRHTSARVREPEPHVTDVTLPLLDTCWHDDHVPRCVTNAGQLLMLHACVTNADDCARADSGTVDNSTLPAHWLPSTPHAPRSPTHVSSCDCWPPRHGAREQPVLVELTILNASHACELHASVVSGLSPPRTVTQLESGSGAFSRFRHSTTRDCVPPPQLALQSPNEPTNHATPTLAHAPFMHRRCRLLSPSSNDGSAAFGHAFRFADSLPSLCTHTSSRHCSPMPHSAEQSPQCDDGSMTYGSDRTSMLSLSADRHAEPLNVSTMVTRRYVPTGMSVGSTTSANAIDSVSNDASTDDDPAAVDVVCSCPVATLRAPMTTREGEPKPPAVNDTGHTSPTTHHF
jgi:hypothetical protein